MYIDDDKVNEAIAELIAKTLNRKLINEGIVGEGDDVHVVFTEQGWQAYELAVASIKDELSTLLDNENNYQEIDDES
jgi:hypothetical protein